MLTSSFFEPKASVKLRSTCLTEPSALEMTSGTMQVICQALLVGAWSPMNVMFFLS